MNNPTNQNNPSNPNNPNKPQNPGGQRPGQQGGQPDPSVGKERPGSSNPSQGGHGGQGGGQGTNR
jgi:hypothetical protein